LGCGDSVPELDVRWDEKRRSNSRTVETELEKRIALIQKFEE